MINLWRLISVLAFYLVTIAASLASTSFSAHAQADASGTISTLETPAATAQVVNVGMYVNTVYQLEVASSTYYLDAYLWFKWKGC